MSGAKISIRHAANRCLLPLVRRAARAYAAGERFEDALDVQSHLAAKGIASTIGYWNSDSDPPAKVAEQYIAALEMLEGSPLAPYLSIKLPALAFSPELLAAVAACAAKHNIRLHFDAMWPESVEPTWKIIEDLLERSGAPQIGVTLPGRWVRSVGDAEWAADRGLYVRVVKGQWPDPSALGRDMRLGFLEVIERLAGSARGVAVASHDVPLAHQALRRLQATRTPCELELLHGLPTRASIRLAAELGVPSRVYIPYGESFLPYALSKACRNPRMIWWLMRDFVAAQFTARPTKSALSQVCPVTSEATSTGQPCGPLTGCGELDDAGAVDGGVSAQRV